jgi:hypothetical protein
MRPSCGFDLTSRPQCPGTDVRWLDCARDIGTATGGPLKPIGICPLHEVGWRGMEESTRVEIFDGHNDAVQHVAEYRRGGRDFLTRSNDGHLDLPRAREGGLIGGLFAVSAMPEHAPEVFLQCDTIDAVQRNLRESGDSNFVPLRTPHLFLLTTPSSKKWPATHSRWPG